jgi:hypothetical protein
LFGDSLEKGSESGLSGLCGFVDFGCN